MKGLVIQVKDKTRFYPEISDRKQAFYKKLLDGIEDGYTADAQFFLITADEYICVFKRNKAVYICETANDISVSQVRLELENFVDSQQKQGKLSKFFSSFFDR